MSPLTGSTHVNRRSKRPIRGRKRGGMQTDYATLSAKAQALKSERDQKRRELARAKRSGDALAAVAAKAEAIRADKKYQQAVRVAIGGIKRIARRGLHPTNPK